MDMSNLKTLGQLYDEVKGINDDFMDEEAFASVLNELVENYENMLDSSGTLISSNKITNNFKITNNSELIKNQLVSQKKEETGKCYCGSEKLLAPTF